MNREIIFAIIAGGILGLAIAFGVWKGNSLLNLKKTTSTPAPTTSSSPNPEAGTPTTNKIVLIKPETLDVFTASPAVVSGITNPDAYIVVSSEDTDTVTKVDATGNFTQNVSLTGGTNQVKLTSFTADGIESNKNIILVFSSQFTSPSASDSAKPISYIGTVTDISNSVIQIKNDGGDIQQISPIQDAAFIDLRNNNVKTIQAKDVAIGDFLVAMGTKDGNNILSSTRILVTDPLEISTRRAFFGTVSASDPSKLTLTNSKTSEAITVTPNAYLQITGGPTRFSGIEDGNTIIAVGEFTNGKLDARTIQVVK